LASTVTEPLTLLMSSPLAQAAEGKVASGSATANAALMKIVGNRRMTVSVDDVCT
jgi:hypothetical protein